jgi:hypothetical protein
MTMVTQTTGSTQQDVTRVQRQRAMTRQRVMQSVVSGISLLLCGLSLGWLTGMTQSPITAAVVGAFIALFPPLLPTLDAIKNGTSSNTRTLAYLTGLICCPLLLGTAVGAASGLYMRSHSYLSPTPKEVLKRWTDAGFTKAELKKPFLASAFDKSNKSSDARSPNSALWANEIEFQNHLEELTIEPKDEGLASKLVQLSSSDPGIKAIYDAYKDDTKAARKAIKLFVEISRIKTDDMSDDKSDEKSDE